jgi:hypothetical protein
MKKSLKDLLIKDEYGFTESFSQEMTSGKNGRLQLFDSMDLFAWVNQQCFEKCGIEPTGDIMQGATCDDCSEDCPIAYINLAIIKLGMIEDAIEKIEVVGEKIGTQVKK